MTQIPRPIIGPAQLGTLVTPQGAATVASYCQHLNQQVVDQGQLSQELTQFWQCPDLEGANYWLLANQKGKVWLRIIEDQTLNVATPLNHRGWLALEICVRDVDQLGQQLTQSPFKIIGAPTDLDVSDKIRAMQVTGLAGEVLYLTEIKAPVPPFELPQATCSVDSLFIPVLCSTNRNETLAWYEQLSGNEGMSFDTKITVVNRAHGFEIDHRHPVATLQLAGNSLIEIDQLSFTKARTTPSGRLDSGIAMISFYVADFDALPAHLLHAAEPRAEQPYNGARVLALTGPAGERLELIEQPTQHP